jgi:hypothetical protein
MTDTVISQCLRVAGLYLDACEAGTPEEAADFAAQAQAELDAACAATTAYGRRAERWEQVGQAASRNQRLGPLVGMALAAAVDRHDSQSENDPRVVDLYAQITGDAKASPDPAMAVSISLQLVQVDFICDERRFADVAHAVYQALIVRPEKLKALLQSPVWQQAYDAMNQELVEIGAETRRLLPDFVRPTTVARSMIRLGHALTERCAKPLASTLLAVCGSRTFDRLLQRDVGGLLDQVRQAGLADLVFGFDKALRHADAHAAFIVRDEGVQFTSSPREYDALTWDQLFDRVIGGLESVLGINLGLFVAASEVGITLDALESLGFTVDERLQVVFSLAGMEIDNLEVDGGLLRGSLQTSRDPGPQFLAMLLPYLPLEVATADLTVLVGGQGQHWEADMNSLRRWSVETDVATKDRLFRQALTTIRRNGVPLLSRSSG